MQRYVALLRAVNVGKRQMKMAELKKVMESLDFKNVVTFIASGNVAFDANESDERAITKKIEEALAATFGFAVDVFIRSTTELQQLVKNPLVQTENLPNGVTLYVSFLLEELPQDVQQSFEQIDEGVFRFKVQGRELFTIRDLNLGESKPAESALPKGFKILSTTRNWNTVKRLATL